MKIPMKVEFPMPEDIRDLYTEDEHEFLIAVSDGYYGGDVYSDESLHEAQFEILGKIDLTTGKKIKGRGSASWIAAKYPNTVEYNNYFDKVNDSILLNILPFILIIFVLFIAYLIMRKLRLF